VSYIPQVFVSALNSICTKYYIKRVLFSGLLVKAQPMKRTKHNYETSQEAGTYEQDGVVCPLPNEHSNCVSLVNSITLCLPKENRLHISR
jgi:hypothetical protein